MNSRATTTFFQPLIPPARQLRQLLESDAMEAQHHFKPRRAAPT